VDLNQRKEQFSNAYVRAVASVAGFTLAKPEVDDDSIDLMNATPNTTNVTVEIPQANLFNPISLTAIMERIGGGGLP